MDIFLLCLVIQYITIPPIEHIGFERCGGINCTQEKIYFPDSYKSYSIRLHHEPKLVHDGHYHKIQYPENLYISYLIIDDIYFFEGGLIDFRWIQTFYFSKLNIHHCHFDERKGERYCKEDCYYVRPTKRRN